MNLAICIPIKNRYRVDHPGTRAFGLLYPHCLNSVLEAKTADDALVVLDWASTDQPVAGWLEGRHPDNDAHVLEYAAPGFNRGRARNLLATYALDTLGAQNLLFLDADITISRGVLQHLTDEALRTQCAVFPVCRRLTDPKSSAWRTMNNSHGVCYVSAALWTEHGLRWPEATAAWGSEDGGFADLCRDRGIYYRMPAEPGLVHLWHPNDVRWKDRYIGVQPQ